MKRFVGGEDRRQATLLPDTLEDYVREDNPVRLIDVFIDELDLEALGFAGVVPEVTGRPAYHPATLLKIYLYGYLNRIQSRAAGTRDPAQHRVDVADRPADAGLQDDRRLSPRQRAGDPCGLRAVHCPVSAVRAVRDTRKDRRSRVGPDPRRMPGLRADFVPYTEESPLTARPKPGSGKGSGAPYSGCR